MISGLFNNEFKISLWLFVLVESLSLLAYHFHFLSPIFWLTLILAALILSLKKLAWGIYLIVAELFVGSFGYLFSIDLADFRISLRLGLFAVVMIAWLVNLLKKRSSLFFSRDNVFLASYLIIFLFILVGLVNGLAHQSFSNLFFDFNGWLYLALVPVFFEAFPSVFDFRKVLNIFLAALVFLSIKTLVIYLIFVHQLLPLEPLYGWIRDLRLGEITLAGGNAYRIFIQSQIYLLIGLLVVLSLLNFAKEKLAVKQKRWLIFTALAALLALIISMSRSYWLAAAGTFVLLLIFAATVFQEKLKRLGKIFLVCLATVVLEIGLLTLITNAFTGNLIEQRLQDPTLEAAGSSRVAQLQPLWTKITKQPLLGYGYGQTVTYQSDDPRIRKQFPDGWYTTYAFEWGYLDIWLKLGLLGLIAYLFLIYKIIIEAGRQIKRSNFPQLTLGLVLGLIALLITSIFSPYLNHPLGIGYLMLISSFIFSLSRTTKDQVRDLSRNLWPNAN